MQASLWHGHRRPSGSPLIFERRVRARRHTSSRRRLPGATRRTAGAAALLGAVALGAGACPSAAAPAAPACVPPALNTSAALAGGAVTVSPAPETMDASYRTQISFLGVPAADIAEVAVAGSLSGSHPGQLAAYPQGDGASFLPSAPFAQGERVSVGAALRQGAGTTRLSWSFTVAQVDVASRSLSTPPPAPPPPNPKEFQHFRSSPGLQPPAVAVTVNSGRQAAGDLFLAPYAGPGQYGPMILDSSGRLLWFRPVPAGARSANLRVQEYRGQPVLTWWQDPLVANGHGGAGLVIADSAYRDIAIVRAANGYEPDLHAFTITPRGTALFTVYDAIRCNLRAYGGPADGALADTLVQEIDLATGLVRFEWHSLDHVALADSYMPVRPGGSRTSPWDYFHINGIDAQPDGDLLVNSRNTWAAYEVDHRSGQILWRIGGKHASLAMGPGTSPAWGHDATERQDGTITFFDNGGTPNVHPQSRGIVLGIDPQHTTATLVSSFAHPTPLRSGSQGNFQALAGGDWLVGWGQVPYFSEFAPAGKLLFDAHLPSAYQSYTVLKFGWSGTPTQPPRIAVRPRPRRGVVVYASWNGATALAHWRVLAGASPRALAPLAAAPRRGFEIAIALRTSPRYIAVQALDAQGRLLGTSAIARS